MYQYRLITRRYCSPTSVVISLQFDLPASPPISSRLHHRHCPGGSSPRWIDGSLLLRTRPSASDGPFRLSREFSPSESFTSTFRVQSSIQFARPTRVYPSRVHLVPAFTARRTFTPDTSLSRSCPVRRASPSPSVGPAASRTDEARIARPGRDSSRAPTICPSRE